MAVIAREFKRVAGESATRAIGFRSIPDAPNYIIVTRNDLPVLAEPNLRADNLTLLGLAQEGDYFPVLEETEIATLNNPLSTRPSNNGKWVKVQTASGNSGWIMLQPWDSKAFAQVMHRPVPAPSTAGNAAPQGGGEVVGIIIVLGLIVYGLVKLGGSDRGSVSSGGGSCSTQSSDEYESSPAANSSERKAMDDLVQWGVRSGTIYEKTGMFSKEEMGSTDKEGKIYKKTGMFSKDEVGSVDEDGKIYRKTGMFSKDEVGSVDKDGKIYTKTGMFSKEEVGSIDKEGKIYKKTGMFSKEEMGRIEKKK